MRLSVLPPSQPNEMSPPPPRRKLRSASRKPNRDPSPTSKKKVRRFSPRTYSRRGKDASPPVELSFENDESSSGETSALTTQSNRGSTTSSANNRAIDVFNSAVVESVKDIIIKLEKDDAEGGDGGDSDEEGIEANDHEEAMYCAIIEREEDVDNTVQIPTNHGSAGYVEYIKGEKGCDVSDPSQIKLPSIPDDWKAKKPNTIQNEPKFTKVDNPGAWPEYCFNSAFEGKGKQRKYAYHSLPTGVTPVPPKGKNGTREVGGWTFVYDGWNGDSKLDIPSARHGANSKNLFPEERHGSLDGDHLQALGLTSNRMKNVLGLPDALFFHQLLLPMCDTQKSGVEHDNRLNFYDDVTMFSSLYQISNKIGAAYGHELPLPTVDEFVKFDGVVVRDGIHGRGEGAIYRRWQDGACGDDLIKKAITATRWHEIKRIYKLCNNDTAPKRGEDKYDPAYKFDLIFKVIVNNVNNITKYASLDLCGDETTWGHAGYGEAGSGITGRIMNKPGISKGGQIVVITDSNRIRPRAYIHRHKLHTMPDNWTLTGQSEVRNIVEQLLPHVEGEPADPSVKKIFKEKFHSTWDNYFSGDVIMDWLGTNGFSATMTCRRDRLPSGVPGKYLHKQKTLASHRTKIARFLQPVVAIKEDKDELYRRVHCSFQSTSSCNISTVNALNECKLYTEARQRGSNISKRVWGIEMNEARRTYLSNYFRVDVMDHMIKNANVTYRSWKYWHGAMLHAKGMAIVVAYDMYLEVCEGKLNEDWANADPVSFHTFREQLSAQMLAYDPRKRLYPGDEFMRISTKQPSNVRPGKQTMEKAPSNADGTVSIHQFQAAKRGGKKGRLTFSLNQFNHHCESVVRVTKNPWACYVCGHPTYTKCGICDAPLHMIGCKGPQKSTNCYLKFHDPLFFGLCKNDYWMTNRCQKKSDWTMPSPTELKLNACHMRALHESTRKKQSESK